MKTFEEINDATGFAQGDKFADASDVRGYFTVAVQKQTLPRPEDSCSQDELDCMADLVIENHWHMV